MKLYNGIDQSELLNHIESLKEYKEYLSSLLEIYDSEIPYLKSKLNISYQDSIIVELKKYTLSRKEVKNELKDLIVLIKSI